MYKKNTFKFNGIFIFTLFILLKGITMAQATESKLYYGVDIDLYNVGVDIRVNDIPVYYDYSKGQLKTEVPAVSTIIDGNNTLSINAFLTKKSTEYETGAYVKATLFEQDLSFENSRKIILATTMITLTDNSASLVTEDFISKEKNNSEIELPQSKEASITVNTLINSPFPRWAWQDGQKLTNNNDTFTSLLNKYQEIHNVLENKNITELKKLYNERAKETAIAYHLPSTEAGIKKLSVGNDMNDPELQLFFSTKAMEINILANGKLAQITNPLNGQPIVYVQSSPRLYHIYKFMFYKNAVGQWVMIR